MGIENFEAVYWPFGLDLVDALLQLLRGERVSLSLLEKEGKGQHTPTRNIWQD